MTRDLNEFWKPYRGAVSITFDDGLDDQHQLDLAVPLLNEFGLRGTFFVCTGNKDWQKRRRDWIKAAAQGHEIGNHTQSHAGPNNLVVSGGLEEKTLADVEADILAAQKELQEALPQQKRWTFAYPCYQTHVGRGAARQSFVPVVAKHFVAGRGGGEFGFGNHPVGTDLACCWGTDCQALRGYTMIGVAEENAAQGRWAILVFHAINGDCLSVARHDFTMLLRHLQRRSKEVWVAPMGEVAEKIAAFQGNQSK